MAAGCGVAGPRSKPRRQLFADALRRLPHARGRRAPEGSSGSGSSGPNLNQRHETPDQVLYAIRNGGFSGAIMPQNVVVGKDAQAVAAFVAKYAGSQAKARRGLKPGRTTAAGRRRPARVAVTSDRRTLDLKLIRQDPEGVKRALARRGAAGEIDALLELDARRRELLPRGRGAPRRQKSSPTRSPASARRAADADAEIAAMRELSDEIKR